MKQPLFIVLISLLVICLALIGCAHSPNGQPDKNNPPNQIEASSQFRPETAPLQGPGGNKPQLNSAVLPEGTGRHGPAQTGGVAIGGAGGNGRGGPGGPGRFSGLEGAASAGIGGRGGGGGLSGLGRGGIPGQGRPGSAQTQAGSTLPGLAGGPRLGGSNPGLRPSGLDRGLGEPGAGLAGGGGGLGSANPLPGPGTYQFPSTPGMGEYLTKGITAQETTQAAATQGQAAVDQAVDVAQEAYEQMWDEYYEAVDYAAQVYYETVIGAIDYGAETFETYYSEAVTSAQQAVTTYYQDYADYQTYTALYPWDSYAYEYDEATQTYVTDEPVNVYYYNYTTGSAQTAEATMVPVATATAPQAAPVPPAAQLPAPSADAYEAIVIFANDQLGATVTPVYAGAATQEALNLLAMLPQQLQAPAYAAQTMSSTAYYALLNGGVAMLAMGECTEELPCQLSGEMPVDLSQATLGVYALQTVEAMPTSSGQAQQLVTLLYPKLTGLEFVQVADVPGYAFSATTTSVAVVNGQPAIVTKVVFTGVTQVNGRTLVYAAVGLGETYAALLNPFQTPQ